MKLIIIGYLVFMNLLGFCLMGMDKSKARRGAWRIPEKTLFGVAFFGGSIGSILGMQMFRHKTKHWYFIIGMPAILLLHILLAVGYYLYW